MLIGLSGAVTGYNGTYPFEKPGDKYNGTSYEGMRIVSVNFCKRLFLVYLVLFIFAQFCTTLGALIVPMSFSTVHELTDSTEAAIIAAAYLLFGEYCLNFFF